jgi:SAM-dependent methyltransferase
VGSSSDDPVRRSFDSIADLYAEQFARELDRKPFDRDLLGTFARLATDPVADLGCGPGQVGAYVASFGRRVVGTDFSTESLRHGRVLFPAMRFVAGDLLRLPFADGSLGGALAFYSLIFGDEHHLALCVEEIRRVLRPGGAVLLAVHGGEGSEHHDTFEGRPIDVTIVGRDPGRMAAVAGDAGLRVDDVRVREPYDFEFQTRRIFVIASAP